MASEVKNVAGREEWSGYDKIYEQLFRMSVQGHGTQKKSMKKWSSAFIYFETDSKQVYYDFYKYS